MKKINNKGFMLVETLIVSTIVLTTLVFLFVQFRNINRTYEVTFRYDTVDGTYAVNNVKQYLLKNGIADVIDAFEHQEIPFIDLSTCPSAYLKETQYCISLLESLNIKQLLFARENPTELRNYLRENLALSESTIDYINYLRYAENANRYRLIVAFDDGTFATLAIGEVPINIVYNFDYTGNYQEFVAPSDGTYQIELWGASGTDKGHGAYTSGLINLNAGMKLYLYVGQGSVIAPNVTSFNGSTSSNGGRPGGGATDVRLASGLWNSFDSLKTRIMVAAGSGTGSGASDVDKSYGGALTGGNGSNSVGAGGGYGYGATQTSFGATGNYASAGFGFGGAGCGGGGGYYGGGGASCANGGGGGSSFISGHTGCNAIAANSTVTNIVHTGSPNHYSGLVFTSTTMIAGNASMPNPRGSGNITGNEGNGYARITLVSVTR